MPSFHFAGQPLELVLLIASLLMAVSVLASKASGLLGVPSLLLFLGIGMLAGSEGPGGIEFSNYGLAFAIGSISLAIILFDGGMRTPWASVRPVLATGISLSTVGVLATAVLTGAFAHYVFALTWTQGLLLGAIVSSTDAAAVFSVLRAKSLALRGRLKQLLEFEAGSNDPSAIFLTVAALTYATRPDAGFGSFVALFALQAGLGFALGWLGGRAILWLINRVNIEYEGLYSVLLVSCVLIVFSGTTALGGSGFLAVYVAGVLLGNSELLHKSRLLSFHDALAWVAQILLFLTLGLLVFPSHLVPLWKEGLLIALFLIFVARPVSVLVAAPTRSLEPRDRLFVSWVGLRGAAPILLATLPWSVGFPHAEYFFNLVFFVVLVSVLIQGPSIPWVATMLKLVEPLRAEASVAAGMLPDGFVAIEIKVLPAARALGRRLVELALPSGVLLTSLERSGRYLVPRGDTQFAAGDTVRGFARLSNFAPLKEIFGQVRLSAPPQGESVHT